MTRQRSLLSAAVAQWIEAERGTAPLSRGKEQAFAQAEGAALLALTCLVWGGEAKEGAPLAPAHREQAGEAGEAEAEVEAALQFWRGAISELPLAGLTAQSRHAFYSAFVRRFAMAAAEDAATLWSREGDEDSSLGLGRDARWRGAFPIALAKMLGVLPTQAAQDAAESFEAATIAGLRWGAAGPPAGLASQLRLGDDQALEIAERSRGVVATEAAVEATRRRLSNGDPAAPAPAPRRRPPPPPPPPPPPSPPPPPRPPPAPALPGGDDFDPLNNPLLD